MSTKDDYPEIFTADPKSGTDLMDRPKDELEYPRQYNVILLNDDFTPFEFVIFLLKKVFHRLHHAAEQIAVEIHKKGSGVAGTYSREVAEMKLLDTMALAKQEQHPLQAKVEPCD